MATRHSFTPEQLEHLLSNPYTHSATPTSLIFTKELKEFFYKQMTENDLPTRKIMELAGYDPDIIGRDRMDKLRINVRHEAASPEGFKEPKGPSSAEKAKKKADALAKVQRTDAKVRALEDKVAHLEAQIEFLKKTQAIRAKYRKQDE